MATTTEPVCKRHAVEKPRNKAGQRYCPDCLSEHGRAVNLARYGEVDQALVVQIAAGATPTDIVRGATRDAAIVALWQRGVPRDEIVGRLQCPARAIERAKARAGLTRKPVPKPAPVHPHAPTHQAKTGPVAYEPPVGHGLTAPDWTIHGRCVGADDLNLWFDDNRADEAVAECLQCPVRRLCLDAAMHEEATTWGGRHGVRGARTADQRAADHRNQLRRTARQKQERAA